MCVSLCVLVCECVFVGVRVCACLCLVSSCLRVYKCARAHVCRRLYPTHETENVYVSNRQRPSLLPTGLLEAPSTSVTRRSSTAMPSESPAGRARGEALP